MANLTPKQAIDLAQEKKATYVDLKFMDFLGIWQHFSIPLDELTEAVFEEGLGFDGSSIRGWQAIHASDMLVMPDSDDGGHRPVHGGADALAHLQHRRPDHQGALLARPAQHRPQGREVPQVDRHRRHRLLRPGAGVLHLRRGPLRLRREPAPSTRSTRSRGSGTPAATSRAATSATSRATRKATSRSPPTDTQQDIRTEMCRVMESVGIQVERQHHEVATAGQAEIDMRFDSLVRWPTRCMWFKYIVKNVARRHGKTVDLHAQAALRRQRLGHARAPVDLEGRQAALRRRRVRRPVRAGDALHRRHPEARPGAGGAHQPDHQQLQAAGAGLRGAGQPGLLGAQPLGRRSASRCTRRRPRRSASSSAPPTRAATATSPSPPCSWPASTASRTRSTPASRSTRTSTP